MSILYKRGDIVSVTDLLTGIYTDSFILEAAANGNRFVVAEDCYIRKHRVSLERPNGRTWSHRVRCTVLANTDTIRVISGKPYPPELSEHDTSVLESAFSHASCV